MSIGIIGAPQSGKTTLFRLLSALPVDKLIHEPRAQRHQVAVPDERLSWLSAHYRPKKTTPAMVEFLDFPSLDIRQAGRGKNELLGHIRTDTDALLLVLRGFQSDALPGAVDPQRELAAFQAEFQIADMDVMEKRLEKLAAQIQKRRTKEDAEEHALIGQLLAEVGDRSLRELELGVKDAELIRGFRFLSLKPLMVVVNFDERTPVEDARSLTARLASMGPQVIGFRVKTELDLMELDEEERALFAQELGVERLHRDEVIQEAYAVQGLHSFYTVGEDECRAWTIHKGDTVLTAAGRIHNDLAKHFIAAEVFRYEDLRALGDEKAVKAAGKMRLEGRETVVGEAEVVHIRHGG